MANEILIPPAPAAHLIEGNRLAQDLGAEGTVGSSTIRVALLADCMATYRLEILRQVANSRGIVLDGVASTVTDLDVLDSHAPDLVILFPWTYNVLAPLWSLTAILDETARAERVDALKDYLTATIHAVASKLAGCLVLVQGLASPPVLPYGRMEFRSKLSYRRILFEINEHICGLIRDQPNMFFVDEDRLFSNLGKRQLLNHASAIYSQYVSGVYDPRSGITKLLHGPMITASREYLDFFLMWSGRGKIKCIVTDLDNTLWPGEMVADTQEAKLLEFAMSHYGGLHEALRILQSRGVLLATCSKNTLESILDPWAKLVKTATALGFEHFLGPSDFVIHKINWKRKSDNIREIALTLGFTTDSLIFIDDSPVEREEVKQAHPSVTVLDSLSMATRFELLTDPRLEVVALTQEARARTEMTKAQLRREDERRASIDQESFLRNLDIKIRVTLDRTATRLDRIAELIKRTHQFNTTQTQHDASAISSFLSCSDTELYTAEVADKFTDYGLVGVCIIRSGEIDTFVISCRIIGLKVEVPFLVSALGFGRWAGLDVRGRIIETEVNQPCRNLFLQACFTREDEGWFVARQGQRLATIDSSIHEVTVREEVGSLAETNLRGNENRSRSPRAGNSGERPRAL
jgi:FkbH-like protein